MLRIIIWREWLDHVRTARFAAMFILVVLLFAASALFFCDRYEREMNRYVEDSRDSFKNITDDKGQVNLGRVCCSGFNLFKAPGKLAFLADGQDDAIFRSVTLFVHSIRALNSGVSWERLTGGATAMDWAFLISVVLGFAAGIFTYKAISGERADGTLSLTLSCPLSRATLLLGKYLGALLAVALPMVVGMMASLAIILFLGPISLSVGEWGRIAIGILLSLSYVSLFVMIGLLISVRSRGSLTSAMIFLFVWVILSVGIPTLGGFFASRVRSIDTPAEMASRFGAIADKVPEWGSVTEEELGRARMEWVQGDESLLFQWIQQMIGQVEAGRNVLRISPAAAFTFGMEKLAGVGIYRIMPYLENARRFREQLLQSVIETDRQQTDSRHIFIPYTSGFGNFSDQAVDLGEATRFRDSSGGTGIPLSGIMLDVGLLILWNGIIFLIAFAKFARADVTPGIGE